MTEEQSVSGVTARKPEQVPSVGRPSVGRIVHFVLNQGRNVGEHRPAIIVRVWDAMPHPGSAVQLQVFTDQGNDDLPGTFWATSVTQDPTGTRPHSWHWPEHVPAR